MTIKQWLGVGVVMTGLLFTVGCSDSNDEPSEPVIEDDATPGVEDEGSVTTDAGGSEEVEDEVLDDTYDVDVDL